MLGFDVLHPTQFAIVNKQVETGLYVVKRTAYYLRKACAEQEQFAKEIHKLTTHEDSKMKVIQEDAMFHYVSAAVEVTDLINKMAQRQQKMAEQTIKSIIEPLETFIKKAEEKRKKVITAEAKLTSSIKDMRSLVSKERQSCVKLFEECLEVKKELDEEERKENNSKSYEKIQKKLLEKREKAKKSFKKFEELREKSLISLDEFYNKHAPEILTQMTEIETDRLNTMKVYMQHFSQLQLDCTAPIPASNTFADMVTALNAEAEMKVCVNRMISEFGDVKAREPMEVDIPCSSDLIMTDQWFKGGDVNAPAVQSNARVARVQPAPPAASAQTQAYPGQVKLWVKAMFDYPQGQPGDLTFHAGDIIGVLGTDSGDADIVIDPNNPGWWTGFVHGSSDVGRFPNNYTEAIHDQSTLRRLNVSAVASSNQSQAPHSKPLHVHTDAEHKSAVDHDLMHGASSVLYAKALYDYAFEPTGDAATDGLGYISFRAGDMIEVKSQAEGEWWYGTFRGQTGYFPANLVELHH